MSCNKTHLIVISSVLIIICIIMYKAVTTTVERKWVVNNCVKTDKVEYTIRNHAIPIYDCTGVSK